LEPLLYLAHRLPYPPNKGDKVRSFNLLRHLSKRYRVHLGCFVDYAEDMQHVPALAQWCASSHVERIDPRLGKALSLSGLLTGEALTLPYYRSAAMTRWVRQVIDREGIRNAVVFSSAMGQYVQAIDGLSSVVDFCDVDSAKWAEYGRTQTGPMAWLYRREGDRLLAFERALSQRTTASVFVSQAEADLFVSLAPEAAPRTVAVSNGVDAAYFAPAPALPDPLVKGAQSMVFTGAMDYWPNIDAATSFVSELWPAIAAARPALHLWLVGMNPAPAVRNLAGPRIHVTGTVPDVRPYLQHADLVIAPLRIARGIQNKVLEAMAMGCAVVCSGEAAEGIDAMPGIEFAVARDPATWLSTLADLLDNPARAAVIGHAARDRVLSDYSWDAHLSRFDRLLDNPDRQASSPRLSEVRTV